MKKNEINGFTEKEIAKMAAKYGVEKTTQIIEEVARAAGRKADSKLTLTRTIKNIVQQTR